MSHHASFHRASRGRRAVLTHSHRRDGVTIGQVADHPHPTCGGQHPACIDAAPDAHLSGAAAARRSTERSRPHASRPRCKGEPSSWSGSRRLPLTVLIRLGMELGTAFEGARARLGPLRCVRSCRQVGVGEQMGTSTRSSHGHVSHNLECTVDLSKTRQRAHPAIPMRRVAYSVHSFLLERLGAKPQARVYCSTGKGRPPPPRGHHPALPHRLRRPPSGDCHRVRLVVGSSSRMAHRGLLWARCPCRGEAACNGGGGGTARICAARPCDEAEPSRPRRGTPAPAGRLCRARVTLPAVGLVVRRMVMGAGAAAYIRGSAKAALLARDHRSV